MRRRRSVKPRRVIFIGVEGESDRAFAQFLQRCCEGEGRHLHLIVKPGTGGDSVSVVEEAIRHLARHPAKRDIGKRLVLLDRDRIEQDLKAGRNAQTAASGWNLKILFQDPNLEGLLFRLHPGCERRTIAAGDAMTELRKVWPEYRKPPTADQLSRRFTLSDVRRAARHDEELQELLAILGLALGDAPADVATSNGVKARRWPRGSPRSSAPAPDRTRNGA